ncbi:MAG: sensor histidine kinase [Candidatus Binatia bacterium]
MKLTRKLVLALVVAICVVMATGAALQLRREIALFESDMAHDEHAMGQALRVALEAAANESGVDRARELLERIRRSESRVDLRGVWLDAPGESPALAAATRARLVGGEETRIVRVDETGNERQFTYVPLAVAARPAAIELSEPLQPQRSFLRRTELQILGTLVVLVVLCGGAAVWLGVVLVGRPMRTLAEQARRIGAGDLSHRLNLKQRDEIGSLAAELNATCERLAEAQERIRMETEARIGALEQLRHADRLKTVGQLASGVAHELGTPLNVVGGRAKLIAAGALSGGDAAASARIIAEQSDRMAAIIRQLLDFARRRGGRGVVADLREIVARTVDMLAVLARGRRVSVSVVTTPASMPIRTDPHQLQQALANVLMNGIHAMPNGGPLRVEVGPWHGTPPAGRDGAAGYWRIVVEDEGIGIPPEHVPRLFEPFFTTKSVGEGTGLGLAVAHGIVAEHGGWIDVASTPEHGSRFEIVVEAELVAPQQAEAV